MVIEDNGYEVPNWLTKCRDVLTSPPTIGTVTILLLAVFGLTLWHRHSSPAPVVNETSAQSAPASGNQLQVITASPNAAMSTLPDSQAVQNSGGAASAAQSSNTSAPVGPAPATSLNSLQPTGSAQQSGGLTQAVTQTVQSAGNATNAMLNGLGL